MNLAGASFSASFAPYSLTVLNLAASTTTTTTPAPPTTPTTPTAPSTPNSSGGGGGGGAPSWWLLSALTVLALARRFPARRA
jgi:hypothetical protein